MMHLEFEGWGQASSWQSCHKPKTYLSHLCQESFSLWSNTSCQSHIPAIYVMWLMDTNSAHILWFERYPVIFYLQDKMRQDNHDPSAADTFHALSSMGVSGTPNFLSFVNTSWKSVGLTMLTFLAMFAS